MYNHIQIGYKVSQSILVTIVALTLLLGGIGTLAYYAYAQVNTTVPVTGPNGTTIMVPQTGESGIDATLKLLAVVGSIVGSVALVLQQLPWKWARDAGKLAATGGQKVVDVTGDVAVLAMAMNAISNGELAKKLQPYGTTINAYADRFDAGNKQLQYLNPSKYIPKFPDNDPNMPREQLAKNWRMSGLPQGGMGGISL